MAKFLGSTEVDAQLVGLGGWYRSGHELGRVYPAGSHREAVRFVAKAAALAGGTSHEPALDFKVEGRLVNVHVSSPAHGGITDADVRLARQLDAAAQADLHPLPPAGDGDAVIAPYAGVMGGPEPDAERTDLLGGPEPPESGVLGGPEPDEEKTDVLGGPQQPGTAGVMGRPEPDERNTDLLGGG